MDNTSEKYYSDLLRKYLNNECTREELSELSDRFSDNPDELKASLQEFWKSVEEININRDNRFQKIIRDAAQIEKGGEEATTKVVAMSNHHLLYNRWLRIAAVVAFVIAGSGLWYWMNKNQTSTGGQNISEISKTRTLAPGGNKAILTLGDGSQIVLDSTGNGVITRQGNATVVKLDNGSISYNKTTGSGEVMYNTISTPRGGQYQLELADGSKVWLNAESSLIYPTSFNGKERKVSLTGEGYFEIAHIDNKPFKVEIGEMEVNVLGTHFNINGYKDDGGIKTTLLQGAVTVNTKQDQLKIKPGQQSEDNGGFLSIHNDVNLDAVMAWKNGNFLFDRANIYTVMKQVERWYNVDVEYQGKVTKHFGGTISRSVNASEIFKMLEMTGGVHFQVEGNKVIVMP